MPNKLVPIGDLNKLTDEQKTQYYIQVCDYFDLPSELNLLEFIWLDSGDSGRKLVLYAKKGATDRLRDIRGISVTELTQTVGDGFIMFTATGKDKNGRQEIAVGAHETRGLSGKSLADGIAIAQTKAVRRMTLQFVGGGFLDESEITSSVSRDLATAPVMLSQLAEQPVAAPNAAKGTDITEAKVEPVEKPKRRRAKTDVPVVAFSLNDAEPAAEPAPEPIEPVAAVVPVEEPKLEPKPVVPVEKLETTEERQERIFGMPSAKEMTAFRERLMKYADEILPRAGMVPSKGIGGITSKVKAFAKTMFPELPEFNKMTRLQWTQLLEVLDGLGEDPANMVVVIDKKIGA